MNGTLVLDRGDINLTFKRYLEAPVRLMLEADYVTSIEGEGADAEMMRRYLAAWGDREAYAVSHVGFGMNRESALRGARDVRPARYQRHRVACGRRKFPVLDRRERVRRAIHRRPFRHSGDADHHHLDGTEVVRAGVLQDVLGERLPRGDASEALPRAIAALRTCLDQSMLRSAMRSLRRKCCTLPMALRGKQSRNTYSRGTL